MIAFAGLDIDDFRKHYWQQRPLLLRGALPGFTDPLSPEELAGLALEAGVDARLVRAAATGWELQREPLQPDDFNRGGCWTLLVQAVDHYLPQVAALRQAVSFIPAWRLDDVMVSYATDGGGVGPHYDNYDVFLLQGQGRRRWQLGAHCDGDESLRDTPGLRILEQFEPTADYLLEPGDVLYVPPRLAHWGTACSDACMTYSLGFRAPRLNDLLSRWLDAALEQLDPELLYADPLPLAVGGAGEILPDCVAAALAQVRDALAATQVTADWFGELVTETGAAVESDPSCRRPGRRIRLLPAARLAWREQPPLLRVYANGETLETSADQRSLLEQLCGGHEITVTEELAAAGLVSTLVELGCIEHV